MVRFEYNKIYIIAKGYEGEYELLLYLLSTSLFIFQTLPDQQHCYFLSDRASLKGILVSSIPFRHPSQVNESFY